MSIYIAKGKLKEHLKVTAKVNQDECITRVYQFLNNYKGDWKADADKNGDNTIVKAEFRSFLLGSDFDWEGISNKEDLISNFWHSIDVNTSGKISGGKCSNKNALDKKELARVGNNIKATNKVNEFVKKITAPSELSTKYKDKWKNSVKIGMINNAIEFLSNQTKELSDEELNSILNDAQMQSIYKTSSIKATADYMALQLMDNLKTQYADYSVGDDKVLKSIIDNYISTLSGDEQDVIKQIKTIVQAYVNLTKNATDKNALAILEKYGYDGGDINPLQMSVIKGTFKQLVVNSLMTNYKDFYESNQQSIDGKISDYAEKMLNSGKDYNYLKNNMSNYASAFVSENLTELYGDYVTGKNREVLLYYVTKQLSNNNRNSERKAAIQKVLGSSDIGTLKETIGKLNNQQVVSSYNTLVSLMSDIDVKVDDDLFSAIPSAITVNSGQPKSYKLPQTYQNSGQITYSVQCSDNIISIAADGTIKINANVSHGTYSATIVAKNSNGQTLNTKTITINVYEIIKEYSISSDVKSWNGQKSSNLEGVLPIGTDDCQITDNLTDTSFSDLYNNDYIVRLHISMDDSESWESAGAIINSRLDQLGNLIVSALNTTDKFDSAILTQAKNNVISKYKSHKFDEGCLNDDDDGTDDWDLTNNLVWRMRNDRYGTGNKVVGTRDDDGSDSWVWGVRFKDVVNDIIAEYNKLIKA